MPANVVFRFREGPAVEWTFKNPILALGEPGFEVDTGKFKIGDGFNKWLDLEYFIPGAGGGGSNLDAHINAPEPHPVYDDGPSLSLLYENAKV